MGSRKTNLSDPQLEVEIYRSLFERMHDAFVLQEIIYSSNGHPVDFRIVYINPSFKQLTGIEGDQILNLRASEVFSDVDNSPSYWLGKYAEAARTGEVVSGEEYIKDLKKWFLVHAYPAGEKMVATTISDISKKKDSEKALMQSESKFRAIVEQSITGIYIFRKDRFLYVNSRFCEIFGYTEKEILTQLKPTDVVQREEFDVASENIRRRLEGEVDSVHYIARGKRKDNGLLWIEIHGTHLQLDQEDVITGTVLDITERFESQINLNESENKFRAAFEQSPNGMCITSLEGYITQANEPLSTMLGYTSEELEGVHFNDITHPDDLDIGKEFVRNMLKGKALKGSFRKRYMTRTGDTVWVQISSALVKDNRAEPAHFITQIEDITDKISVETELIDSERRFRALFEQATLGVAIIETSTGKYLSVNKKHCEITGYSEDEHLKSDFMTITHPDDLAEDEKNMKNLKEGKINTFVMEKRYVHKNGNIVWVILNVYPLWRPGEDQSIHVAICEDVTQKKKATEELEKSEQRYRSLFENMNAGFVLFETILDRKGKPVDLLIVAANKGFEHTTGLSLKNVQGQRLTKVLPGIEQDEADWIGTYSKVAFSGESRHFEQKSELLDTYYTISAFQAGPGLCAVTFIDITGRKNAENAVRELNDTLELKVKQRTRELELLNKELEAFTYSVSHDLRTPLRAIDGFSQFLIEEFEGELTGEGKRYLDIIRSNTEKMDQLISDLLRLSRININQLSYVKANMNILVDQAISETLSDKDKQSFTFEINTLPEIQCDANLMKQVWTNLISNAIKYSAHSKIKKVDIDFNDDEKNHIFYIKDYGVGFDPRYKNKLFGIFERLHSMKEFEGSGVGLAIVQRIIHRHEGRIWAESKINKGAVFYFSIPKEIYHDA